MPANRYLDHMSSEGPKSRSASQRVPRRPYRFRRRHGVEGLEVRCLLSGNPVA